MSKIYTGMVGDNIRFFLADATDMCAKAARVHKTSLVSTIALSRTLTAASILGKTLKNDKDVLTLKIAGSGQIKSILATSDSRGYVKAYISEPDAEVISQSQTPKIGKAIGLGGSVTVIRDFGLKEPYIGMSHLISGEIDDDLAFYFKNSEQQPTWMHLDCKVQDQKLIGAGGLFVQSMPDISMKEKAIFLGAEDLKQGCLDPMYRGEGVEGILRTLYPELALKMTGVFEVDFACDCSRDRISRALLTLGSEDLEEILREDGHADLQCHFCHTNYHFDGDDIQALIDITNA